MKNIKLKRKLKRMIRVRSSLFGLAEKPRISVFRSNKYIYAQAIDDQKKKTIAYFSSLNLKQIKEKGKITKAKQAVLVGQGLAKLLKKKKIFSAVFDRGSYAYLGRVKILCEELRQGGIKI